MNSASLEMDGASLSSEPLTASTGALKLKELESRFPGATIILFTPTHQGVVRYIYEDFYEDESANHLIWCEFAAYPHHSFASLGVKERPHLMVEWRGIYLDVSYLF
jgi:hypothetical protein